jgi:hypothetical protein
VLVDRGSGLRGGRSAHVGTWRRSGGSGKKFSNIGKIFEKSEVSAMSVAQQWVVKCDQNPLPDRCRQQILLESDTPLPIDVLHKIIRDRDWGIENSEGRETHYCPYHRPVR